jgi:O-acetyl-ADP-ribose deacetylase (regulator of RNase III)
MIIEKKGNIFNTDCQTIVNTINCLGVMGAGIAFEFRLRYPSMYDRYKVLCKEEKIQIGLLWIYSINEQKKILNFPTKYDWKKSTKIEYLEKGLNKFVNTYKTKNITSIAFPFLGANNGGLSKDESFLIMKKYLIKCDIPIEIWHYESSASDDLFEKFKSIMQNNHIVFLAKETSINQSTLMKIKENLTNPNFSSISSLLNIKGIGKKTIEKLFQHLIVKNSKKPKTLFE